VIATLKPDAVAFNHDIFDEQDGGLVVQHDGRRLKYKLSNRSAGIESSSADAVLTFQSAASIIPKPSIMHG